MKRGLVYGFAALLAFALAGCVSQTEFNRAVKEKKDVEERLRKAQLGYQKSRKDLITQLEDRAKKAASLEVKVYEQEATLKGERAKSADLASEVERLKALEAEDKENLAQVRAEVENAKKELAAAGKQLDATKAQLKEKDGRIADLEALVKELQAELEAKEEEAEPVETTE